MEQLIVLFSGGIDSTTALVWSRARTEGTSALTYDYGQRNRGEIRAAQKIAADLGIPLHILRLDLGQIGGSSLTDLSVDLPRFDDLSPEKEGIPSTYVPFRNGIFLAMAAAWAETRNITGIVCGFNRIDSPNYPDTREDFVKAMEKAIHFGTSAAMGGNKICILAPFLDMKKSEIIKTGLSLGADYSHSLSCYTDSEIPCQQCSSCVLRRKAWKEVGKTDPLLTRLKKEGKL
jgi:7-cyano-7-deazaguanine synthase